MVNLPTTKDGYKHICLVLDHATRYLIAFPLRTLGGMELAEQYMDHVTLKYGAARTLITDNGSNIISKSFQSMAKLIHMESRFVSLSYTSLKWRD